MTGTSRTAIAVLVGVSILAPGLAEADCKLLQLAEFHLDPHSTAPIVDGTVNGAPVKVLLDTGSEFSLITYDAAKRLGLRLSESTGERAYGVGGSTQIYTADVDHFTVGDLAKSSFNMTVSGDPDRRSDVPIVLGDDVLSNADIEFDFAHNAIRLFKPKGCTPPQLIYWGAQYSQATLLPWGRYTPAIQVKALLNGKEVLAELDSGAQTTLVDSEAAASAGVKAPVGNGDETGAIRGVGPKPEDTWIGRFESFSFGEEKIAHINVRIAQLLRGRSYTETGTNMVMHFGPSMYVGDDFLRAHRVFVDNEDHLILFSYLGGPIFDTTETAATAPEAK